MSRSMLKVSGKDGFTPDNLKSQPNLHAKGAQNKQPYD